MTNYIVLMYRHERQISVQLRQTKNSPSTENDNHLSYSRALQKKHQMFQPPSFIDTSIYLRRQLGKNRKTEIRLPSHNKKSPSKSNEKQSAPKLINQKILKKSSVNLRLQSQQTHLTTHSKLMKINAIFKNTLSGETRSILAQLYQKNNQYCQLLKQWERQQISDEVDSQIYSLTQNLLQIVETVLQNICAETNARLIQYQNYIERLDEQNLRLKECQSNCKMLQDVLSPLKAKLIQVDVKNQWSILILNQIQHHVDVESYIKTTSIFKQCSEPKIERYDRHMDTNQKRDDFVKRSEAKIKHQTTKHSNGTDRQRIDKI